ncbi:tripartite motif-containing protein 16 [Larimichthys crocea]|uniref:tripartite motif-containing protein 16 n=1 Tax=Larimichthys crocea TaxID=215358 RepID=UPI0009017E0B|nr:tripartite motif-containing protein 16 [Larimichthys crocea]
MAENGVQLDRETFSCPICLNLLTDPVTIRCGHSYCMNCIKSFWDEEDENKIHSCPRCGQTFTPRPVLLKNTMLAVALEEMRKTGLQDAPADQCYTEPEDVVCDFCPGRKRKAIKSCMVCLVSCCEKHLQPHYDVVPLKKHKLVNPSKKLQENICSHHDEAMTMFCRTDQQRICHLCPVNEHKDHDTVSAAAESAERRAELEVSRQTIQERIQDKENDVKELEQEVEAINSSADKAVEDSEKIFTELIRLMEERGSDVKQQLRTRQETEVTRAKEHQEKLKEEIAELKRKDDELKRLSQTEDYNELLHNYPSLSESTASSSIHIRPRKYFEDVPTAVSEVRDKLQDVLSKKWANISWAVFEVDVLLSQPQPKTRDDFLKYSCEITLDSDTAYRHIALSNGNRKATRMQHQIYYSSQPERYVYYNQVLSTENLTGRCYWEVEWSEGVGIAVSYKNNGRANSGETGFGYDDKSWALSCSKNSYEFIYNSICTPVSGPRSNKVGVYLDYSAGILSFYSISETMTVLHRVHTTFTEPLYAGIRVNFKEAAEICKLK